MFVDESMYSAPPLDLEALFLIKLHSVKFNDILGRDIEEVSMLSAPPLEEALFLVKLHLVTDMLSNRGMFVEVSVYNAPPVGALLLMKLHSVNDMFLHVPLPSRILTAPPAYSLLINYMLNCW